MNIAAFLSNAMEEGIRICSCDEWNTDFMFEDNTEKYPLSNSCGQYGRSYEDEECPDMEQFQCQLDKTMEITAVEGHTDAPEFTCRARSFDDESEIFPGYYDVVDDVVIDCKHCIFCIAYVYFPKSLLIYDQINFLLKIPAAYSNTVGRTDIEGCCWWGRGVMLTRGR